VVSTGDPPLKPNPHMNKLLRTINEMAEWKVLCAVVVVTVLMYAAVIHIEPTVTGSSPR